MSTTYSRRGTSYIRQDTGTLVVRDNHTVTRKNPKQHDPRMVHLAKQAANKNALAQQAHLSCNLCGMQASITQWENAEVCEECYFFMHDRYKNQNQKV